MLDRLLLWTKYDHAFLAANVNRFDQLTLQRGLRVSMRIQVLDELFDYDGMLLFNVVHDDQEHTLNEFEVEPCVLVVVQIGQYRHNYLAYCGEIGFGSQAFQQHLGFVVWLHFLLLLLLHIDWLIEIYVRRRLVIISRFELNFYVVGACCQAQVISALIRLRVQIVKVFVVYRAAQVHHFASTTIHCFIRLRVSKLLVHDVEQSGHNFVHIVPQIASSQVVIGHKLLNHGGQAL